MGKPKKQSHRFQYDKNRKKAWKKSKRQAAIECEQIKSAWDSRKSVMQNMKNMGLASDANITLGLPKAKDMLGKPKMESMVLSEVREKAPKSYVVEDLEEEAAIPQERRVHLSEPEVDYCVYMLEKYGDDFKKMARDRRNHYQDTPKQIRRKIAAFKSIPEQYNAYLENKGSN